MAYDKEIKYEFDNKDCSNSFALSGGDFAAKCYEAKGILRYKGDWAIVEVPESITNYYKFWVEKFLGKKISTSYHSPHITVVAGKHERGICQHPLWGRYDGKLVEFVYESQIYTDSPWFFKGKYFWLRVHCRFLKGLRKELGLSAYLKFPFHTTIGYCGY